MKHRKLAFLSLMLSGTVALHAQNLDEGVRFSQYDQGTTARFRGLGNAQTALGGDLSNIGGNPAGLGFFNSSDVSISLDYFNDRNSTNYFGDQTNSDRGRFGLNQAGIVFNLPTSRARGSNLESGWLNFNVGIGYQRTNSFYSNLDFSGVNTESGIADFMVDQDLGGSAIGGIGYDMGLFDQVDERLGNGELGYLPPYIMTSLGNLQQVYNSYSGNQSETNISFGANHSNKFYLGGSIGFSSIFYRSNTAFYEDGFIQDEAHIRSQFPGIPKTESRFITNAGYAELLDTDYQYDQQIWNTTRGAGVNLKLGMIYRPVEQIQIGFNATSPTWYRMSDSYDDSYYMENFDPVSGATVGDPYLDETFDNYFEYNFRSPYRLSAGIAAILSRGLISADVEFVDYKSMRFTSSDRNTATDMDVMIQDNLQGAFNFRVGGELMVVPQFMVRAGYNYMGSPYQTGRFDTQSISGGLGYRFGNYYVDLTYQNWTQRYDFAPYALSADYTLETNGVTSPIADVKNTRQNVFLTLGAKF